MNENVEIIKLPCVLAEAEEGISEWKGYIVNKIDHKRKMGLTLGYIAPIMHHRTKKWHFSYTKPERQEGNSTVNMEQFGEGYATIKQLMESL